MTIGPNLFSETDSEDQLWQKLHDHAGQHFGITSALFAFCHSRATVARTGITQALVIRSSHPADAMAGYTDENMLNDDASAAQLFLSPEPVLWSRSIEWAGVTDAQRKRDARDDQIGMQCGVSIGFTFANGQGIGGIGLCARYMPEEQFDAIWANRAADIMAMVNAFSPLMRQRMIQNCFRLTPREKDVLTFAAGGLTAKQIGQQLGITEKAVFKINLRARKSMSSASMVEAVAKASVFGLI
jgi:LuxR family transcriptional regulator, quorum-sensing system regulator SdiA